MTALFSKSSNLVLRSLGYGTAHLELYRVFRWLESRRDPIIASDQELADDMGTTPERIARCLAMLHYIGLIAVSTPQHRRVIAVVPEYSDPVIQILKGIRTGSLTPVMALGVVVENGGDGGAVTECVAAVDQQPAKPTELQKNELQANNARGKKARKKFSDLPELRQQQITGLINRWRTQFGYGKAKHTDPRRAKVNARLEDGYTVEDLELVLDTAEKDPFWRGQNDRNTPYDAIETLFLNAERIDRFLAKSRVRKGAQRVDRVRSDLAVSAAPVTEEVF